MPFGLFNVPTSFQGYINKILAKKLNIFVTVYLNNIFIHTKNAGQLYIDAVQWVLEQLRKNGLFANFTKTKIAFYGTLYQLKEYK